MKLNHCELFHLTPEAQRARMLLCGLTKKELTRAKSLELYLAPVAPSLSGVLMAQLRQMPELETLLKDDGARVAWEIAEFLRAFTRDVGEPEWFEARLRGGLQWARRGLSWPMYFCLVRLMEEQVLQLLHEAPSWLAHLTRKMFTLEISVTSEAFQLAQTEAFEAAVDELAQQLTIEPLTQVSTRLCALSALDRQLHHLSKEGRPLSVLMIDIDFFKSVNDRFGHAGGDRVLASVAQTLRANVRSEDVVGRYGGEEFVILLEGVDSNAAQNLAERLREAVASQVIEIQGEFLSVTISVGVTEALVLDSPDEVLARADAGCYAAKHQGRNRVVAVSEPLWPPKPSEYLENTESAAAS